MKKILLILILLLTTACKDYVEINDFAIISGIILDYKDNKLDLTAELIINEEETKYKTFIYFILSQFGMWNIFFTPNI